MLAYSEKPCQGLDEGRVVDFNEVIPIVGEVLEEAETLSKTGFSELWVGLSGDFHSFPSQGMTVLPSREVTKKKYGAGCSNGLCCSHSLPSCQNTQQPPKFSHRQSKGSDQSPGSFWVAAGNSGSYCHCSGILLSGPDKSPEKQ